MSRSVEFVMPSCFCRGQPVVARAGCLGVVVHPAWTGGFDTLCATLLARSSAPRQPAAEIDAHEKRASFTALHYAALCGNDEVLSALLIAGAKVGRRRARDSRAFFR